MTQSTQAQEKPQLTRKDFVPSVDVRWCPGCGDYAVLSAVQKVFSELGIPREKFVIVSGIGCSSRFPYYMNTYGFHTVHGRAPGIATGIKIANPDLSVWIVTGDGDGLSIGGNHLLHIMRRNPDVNILLFNNRVYGLTKGQYSPTSLPGHKTKTSPMGTIETPINPLCFALASESTFVARTMDTNPKHMQEIFHAAAKHKGTSFIEIFQNCVIFNHETFKNVSGRDVRDDQLLILQDGKPLRFGSNQDKGIQVQNMKAEVVTIGQNGITEDDLTVHNPNNPDPSYAYLLTQMSFPTQPTPMGVFRSIEKPVLEDQIHAQEQEAIDKNGEGNLQNLYLGTYFWSYHKKGEKPQPSVAAASVLRHYDFEFDIRKELVMEADRVAESPILAILKEPIKNVFDKYGIKDGIFTAPHDSIAKAIKILKTPHIDCLLVVDKKKLVGIVTERDILLKVALQKIDRSTTPISSLVKVKPEMIMDSATIGFAINKLSLGGFRHLPVDCGDGPAGFISIKHILGYIYSSVTHQKKTS